MRKLFLTALIAVAAFSYGCSSSASASDSTPTNDPAVKELQQKVSALENTITTLTNRIASLEAATPGGGTATTVQAFIYLDNETRNIATDSYKAIDADATLFMTEMGTVSNPLEQTNSLKTTVTAVGEITILQIWAGYTYSGTTDYWPTAYAVVPTSVYSDAVKTKLIKEIARYTKNIFNNWQSSGNYNFVAPVSM